MVDAALAEALDRLDRWLVRVCDAEEERAKRLVSDVDGGWDGVRALLRPAAPELALSEAPEPLVPAGDHPIDRIVAAFRLEPAPREALLVLVAAHVEPRYQSVYGVLQDDLAQRWCTERLLLTILGQTTERRRTLRAALRADGALRGSGLLVEPAPSSGPLGRTFDLAPEVRDAILGLDPPVAVHGATLEHVEGASEAPAGQAPFVVAYGAADVRRVAREIGSDRRALVLRSLDEVSALDAARATWRVAASLGAAAVVDLRDLEPSTARRLAAQLHADVTRFGGRWTVVAREPLALPVPHVRVEAPTFATREATWRVEAAERGAALSGAAIVRLAANHRMDVERVREVFVAAGEELTESHLNATAFRLQTGELRHGRRVEGRRTFDDLIVRAPTASALHRLVYFLRHRDRVTEKHTLGERFGLERGPIVLFAGRPGTGKTLAAQVVANALHRPLYVVDLAQLVDKYIGETEKNIDRVLYEAEHKRAALFFDDADALFTSRTDVSSSNDRYANLEVGFLLQRIEQHRGLVILATNLQQNLDDAFARRFHAQIEFPKPDQDERRRIWELMVPPSITRDATLDLAAVATAYRLTGGEIHSAAVRAMFIAEERERPLAREHIDEAIRIQRLELGRLSRSTAPTSDYGTLVRTLMEQLENVLGEYLRDNFEKEVHVIHGAPTKEALAGFRPAVSLALYSVAAPRLGGVRLGVVVSTWSRRAEEEYELLGVVHEAIVERSVGAVDGRKIEVRVRDSYDFDMLQRFWTSHNHPVRAGLVIDVEVA